MKVKIFSTLRKPLYTAFGSGHITLKPNCYPQHFVSTHFQGCANQVDICALDWVAKKQTKTHVYGLTHLHMKQHEIQQLYGRQRVAASLNITGHHWTTLDTTGHHCTLLYTFGHYWTPLYTIVHHWTLLDTTVHHCIPLYTIGHHWTLLENTPLSGTSTVESTEGITWCVLW